MELANGQMQFISLSAAMVDCVEWGCSEIVMPLSLAVSRHFNL